MRRNAEDSPWKLFYDALLEKHVLPPHPKYANPPNINAKFQTSTAAINLHDLGFAEREFRYKNIPKETAESCGKSVH